MKKAKARTKKTASRKKKVANKSRYVAVVMRSDTNYSNRTPHRDWSCFVDEKKDEAVKRALKASREWGARYGEYEIFVSKLTELVHVPVEFKLEKL